MLGIIALGTGVCAPVGWLLWRSFNQRRIWVGKWKGRSVFIIAQGKNTRLLIDDQEVFTEHSWRREGVHELKFNDVQQGDCTGVLLIQNITSGEAQTFQTDLILDGEVVSLVQTPSSILKDASLEQSEMIFRAKSSIKSSPKQDLRWDEVLNLCTDIREVSQERIDIQGALDLLQGQLRHNFDILQRMDRAMESYEQLGGAEQGFIDTVEKAHVQQDMLLSLLKKLHTSTMTMQLTQSPNNEVIVDILALINAEVEVEEHLNQDMGASKKNKAKRVSQPTQRNL